MFNLKWMPKVIFWMPSITNTSFMSYKCPKLQKCHKLIQKSHQLQVWLFISVQLNSIANFLLKSSKACLAIPGEKLMNCSWIIHEYCSWIFLINSWTIHECAWTLNGHFMKFVIHEHFSSWTVHELKLAKRFMNIHEQFMNIKWPVHDVHSSWT